MFCKLAFLCMSLAIVPILFRSLGGQSILEATSLSSSSWALSSPSCPAQIAAVYQHRPWSNMKIQHWSNLQNVEVQYDTWLTCIYIYICVYMCIRLQRIRNVYWIRRVRERLPPWHLENLAYISERFPNASKSEDLNLNPITFIKCLQHGQSCWFMFGSSILCFIYIHTKMRT